VPAWLQGWHSWWYSATMWVANVPHLRILFQAHNCLMHRVPVAPQVANVIGGGPFISLTCVMAAVRVTLIPARVLRKYSYLRGLMKIACAEEGRVYPSRRNAVVPGLEVAPDKIAKAWCILRLFSPRMSLIAAIRQIAPVFAL
jgi:hypothetical protein